jgi:hypothetical protein
VTTDVKLGGRLFSPVNMDRRTVLWQTYVDRLVGDSGIDKVLPSPTESAEAYTVRLHGAVMRSGKAPELLGCFLLPLGKTERDWSPAMAAETARFLEQCDTEEDVQQVYLLGMEFVLGFFGRQLRSLQSSLNSFDQRQTAATDRSAAH